MSFLSKLCNDNESRVQDSADVTVGSLSDADLREAVRSALGDDYRLVSIVRRSGDIELQLESERDGMVYQYSYFEPGHVLVDDFKRELSATKLRPVSSYEKKVGDSKGRGRAQDSEGDFYSKKVWGADDSDIARVVRESNPILEHIGWGTNAKRSVDFRMMGDDEVAYVEIPVVAGMTLGDLRDALDPNNLPFPGIVEDSKGCGRAQDSGDVWPYRNTEDPEEARLELEKMFDVYVPASGMADTLGGELLRAYVRLLYRCENDGDVPFEGYGNITCNSSWRFLAAYFVDVLGRRGVLNVSSDWKEWNRTLIDFAPELLSVLNADDGALFRKPNNVDSREATEEDYEAERAEWAEDDEIDDDYIYDSAGHHCKKCDEGKHSENRFSVSDSDDLSGWVKSDGGRLWKAIYRKEYDNMSFMRIFVREASAGHDEFSVDSYLLRDLGLEDLADTLHITAFDSLSEAADVADRIVASYSTFYKSLSDIIEQ